MPKETVILERRYVPKDSLVVREGEAGNCAYLIQSGSVSVFTYHAGQKVELAVFGLGELFGELALIFDEPRSASVIAKEDCNLIIITRDTLQQKMESSDPTVKAIMGMMTRRILTANDTLVAKQTDVDDLTNTSRIIYQNILTSLPRSKQRDFQKSVLPKLDEFLEALGEFRDNIPEKAEQTD